MSSKINRIQRRNIQLNSNSWKKEINNFKNIKKEKKNITSKIHRIKRRTIKLKNNSWKH